MKVKRCFKKEERWRSRSKVTKQNSIIVLSSAKLQKEKKKKIRIKIFIWVRHWVDSLGTEISWTLPLVSIQLSVI